MAQKQKRLVRLVDTMLQRRCDAQQQRAQREQLDLKPSAEQQPKSNSSVAQKNDIHLNLDKAPDARRSGVAVSRAKAAVDVKPSLPDHLNLEHVRDSAHSFI